MADKIVFEKGRLLVPDAPIIPYIQGDGIGVDIWRNTQLVFDKAVEKAYGGQRKVVWKEVLAGKKAADLTGNWLPDETLTTIKSHLVAIKGPLETPVGEGIRSLNVALRQELDLYTCLRPVRYFKGVPSPLKHPEKTDITIFRENTEDIYAGIEWESGTAEVQKVIDFLQKNMQVDKIRFPESSAIGIKPISKQGSERLIRAAIDYALAKGLTRVTLVHKGNIQKFTEGGFRKWGYELAQREYANELAAGKLVIQDVIAPGANINYETGHAIFEATHGTAPDIAGQNKANPCSLLLSGAMLFDYIGWPEVSHLLTKAIEKALFEQKVTGDFASQLEGVAALTTSQFAEELLANIEKCL